MLRLIKAFPLRAPISIPVKRSQHSLSQNEIFPVVDANLPAEVFNKTVFDALHANRGVVFRGVNKSFSSSTAKLFKAYNNFLAKPTENKEHYINKDQAITLQGFYPYPNFLAGSKVADRYFIKTDGEKYIDQALPASWYAAMYRRNVSAHKLLGKVLNAIDEGFNLPAKPFSKTLFSYSNVSVLDAYLPITQEKLKDWASKSQLTKTEDGRIEAFVAHKDFVALTLLSYFNNDCEGLEINTSEDGLNKRFKPLSLPKNDDNQFYVIIMLGRMMELLSNDRLKAVEHRVVIEPMKKGELFQRMTANTFFTHAAKQIFPLIPSLSDSSMPSMRTADYFSKGDTRFTKLNQERADRTLLPYELACYPTESDIEKMPNGFRRK